MRRRSTKKTTIIGSTIHGASGMASNAAIPKRIRMPASMPSTMGIGSKPITRPNKPEKPSSMIAALARMYAPMASLKAY